MLRLKPSPEGLRLFEDGEDGVFFPWTLSTSVIIAIQAAVKNRSSEPETPKPEPNEKVTDIGEYRRRKSLDPVPSSTQSEG